MEGFTFNGNNNVITNSMFAEAKAFNCPIYHWENTSSFVYAFTMFEGASKFNQEIRTWDVSSLFSPNNTNPTTTYEMFSRATAFKQKYTVQDTPGESFWIYFEGGSEEINGETITHNQNPNYNTNLTIGNDNSYSKSNSNCLISFIFIL